MFRALRLLTRRLLHAIPIVLGIAVFNFLLLQLAPGDAADVLAGEAGGASPEYIAQMKARTAIKMKRPSKALEDAVAGGRNAVLKLPDVLPVEGGLPLMAGTEFVGAIGVSGVTSQQDGQIAAAGVAVIAAMK